ncbi:hypothetical protein EX30DRAFT_385737 [Ascodesmis nigricans]|uniref:Ras GEF n=1 Tax=Ascodesmis nigricans TaxID=341454 RepID=A0A4S2MRW4_9PEZI|nr:hypothetical protein EX30DRAFT_385737 [Ascodesmis nigricans]
MIASESAASRGALLQSSPRRREKQPIKPTQADRIATTRDVSMWTRGKAVPPAAINTTAAHGHTGQRGGHQFTVGNVSNGMLYLRPVMRSNQDLRQNFVLPPSTPPSSAEDAYPTRRIGSSRRSSATQQTSPPRTPTFLPQSSGRSNENHSTVRASPPVIYRRHQRSRSYTVATDRFPAIHEHKVRIQIDQVDGPALAPDETRPRTTAQDNFDALDVRIPRYNLGSPRFSPGGTPFMMYASSTALPSTTGEYGSSSDPVSPQPTVRPWLWPRSVTGSKSTGTASAVGRDLAASIVSTVAAGQPASVHPTQASPLALSPLDPRASLSSIPVVSSPPVRLEFGPITINPRIFDKISSPSGSDHPSVVMFHPHTHEIHAATPARIIAEITSATFVDYHLLSDFFLTFRLFMNTTDLASHLMSRFHWALERDDDIGKIVRVRTFVAIRHWILNYFADDFVPYFQFRQEFAKAMNNMISAVPVEDGDRGGDINIIGELKKCWRRTCALYWDPETIVSNPRPEDPITPGGEPGKRNKDDRRLSRLSPPPQLDSFRTEQTFSSDSFLNDVVAGRQGSKHMPTSSAPGSSAPNLSSLGRKPSKHGPAKSESYIPGPSSSDSKKSFSSSRTSSSTSSKASRPRSHKRSGSFSDALRDDRQPLSTQPPVPSTNLIAPPPYSASLVRGNQFPPTAGQVGVIAPATPDKEISALTSEFTSSDGTTRSTNGPAMRKIFGTVKKAFGGGAQNGKKRGAKSMPSSSATTETTADRSTIGTSGSIPGLLTQSMASASDARPARYDLLGEVAMESYQRAMAAIAKQEAEKVNTTTSSSELLTDPTGIFGRQGFYDGAGDGPGEPATASSSVLVSTDMPPVQRILVERDDFLDSPSESSDVDDQERREGFLGADISFLADPTELSVSSRNSIEMELEQDPLPLPLTVLKSPKLSADPAQSDVISEKSVPPNDTSVENTSSHKLPTIATDINIPSSTQSKQSPTESLAPSFLPSRPLSLTHSIRPYSLATSAVTYQDSDTESSVFHPDPTPGGGLLRRRPGGNLRGATTIGELEPRPKSVGSVSTSTYTVEEFAPTDLRIRPFQHPFRPFSPGERSITSRLGSGRLGNKSPSAMGSSGPSLLPPANLSDELEAATSTDNIATGDETEESRGTDTDSAKADFEAGVQLLREIPDDSSEDGLDVALAKLEGTYQRKKSGASTPRQIEFRRSFANTLSRKGKDSFLLEEGIAMESEMEAVRESGWEMGLDGAGESKAANEGDNEKKRKTRERHRHKQVVEQMPLETPPPLEESAEVTPAATEDEADAAQMSETDRNSANAVRESAISDIPESNRSSTQKTGTGLTPRPLTTGPSPSAPISRSSGQHNVNINLSHLDSELERLARHRRTGSSSTRSPLYPPPPPPQRQNPNHNLRHPKSSNPSSDLSFEMMNPAYRKSIYSSNVHSHKNTNSTTPSMTSTGTFPPINPGTVISELHMWEPPLRHPPSPPLTFEQALSMSPSSGTRTGTREEDGSIRSPISPVTLLGRSRANTLQKDDPRSATFPQYSNAPTSNNNPNNGPVNQDTIGSSTGFATTTDNRTNTDTNTGTNFNTLPSSLGTGTEVLQPTPIHLPFILAYDSELLARQFTLIEKDALAELDWKELVELSWGPVVEDVRDWVGVLDLPVDGGTRGVSLAIMRFNLVTRWARSQILLTRSASERARTITKLIHIARHCRCIRNFATMYQLTIALLTTDIVRLQNTWKLVPENDIRVLRELEELAQPTGNFRRLRDEVERAVTGGAISVGSTTSRWRGNSGANTPPTGCIPFIGLFTHDLILNAQRPLTISIDPSPPPPNPHPTAIGTAISTPTDSLPPSSHGANEGATGKLVNFDRHRVTAWIVKRLLSAVEASQGYAIEPVDGVAERCLWLAALGEEELRRLSWGIEPPGR